MTYYQWNRSNKYRSKSTEYNGIRYHSKAEAAYAQELDLRLKAKDFKKWERQFKVSIDIPRKGGKSYHICNYFVDFLIYHNDGSKELVEIKGFETEIYRLKRKLLEAVYLPEHPDMTYTVVKV